MAKLNQAFYGARPAYSAQGGFGEAEGGEQMAVGPLVKVLGTSGFDYMADTICRTLTGRLDISVCKWDILDFPNDNRLARIAPVDIRGTFVWIVHGHLPPVDQRTMEFFHLLDAAKNSGPLKIGVFLSYFDYCRSDNKKHEPGISEMHKIIIEVMASRGVSEVILLDIHSQEIVEYFEKCGIKVTQISAKFLWLIHIVNNIFKIDKPENFVCVEADEGAGRAGDIFDALRLPRVKIKKIRNHLGKVVSREIIGDVLGKYCIIIEDEITKGDTIIGNAELLKEKGALGLFVLATHPIFSAAPGKNDKQVSSKLEANSFIKQVVVTDSVPLEEKLSGMDKFIVEPIVTLGAEAIYQITTRNLS